MGNNDIIRAVFRVAIKREKRMKNAGIKYIEYMKQRWEHAEKILIGIKDLYKSFLKWKKAE